MIECLTTGKFFNEWIWITDFIVECPLCHERLWHEDLSKVEEEVAR